MITLALGASLLAAIGAPADGADSLLYVSMLGNNNWSGKLPLPNTDKTDGPLATLAIAGYAVRELNYSQDEN